MPIATRCSHCKKGYQVAESMVGKSVKCQACGQLFTVAVAKSSSAKSAPAQAAARAAGGATGGGVATASADAAAATRVRQLEKKFGLQPLPVNTNQVLLDVPFHRPKGARHPLANHVVEDPGFEAISEAEYRAFREEQERQEQNAKIDYLANLEDDDELITKEKELYWLYVVAMVQMILGIFTGLLAGASPAAGLILLGIGLFVGGLMPTVDLFLVLNKNKKLGEFVFLLIPFYNLYYYFSNFGMFKNHFFGALAVSFSGGISSAIFFFMADLVGANVNIGSFQ